MSPCDGARAGQGVAPEWNGQIWIALVLGCAGCDVNDGCSGNTRLAGTVHTVVTINHQGQGQGAMGPLLAGEGVALRVGRVCVVRAIGRSIIGEVLQAVNATMAGCMCDC